MGKELTLAQKVRNLKFGKPFIVTTEKERQAVLRVFKSLRDSGAIEFDVVTRKIEQKDGGGFKVAAI